MVSLIDWEEYEKNTNPKLEEKIFVEYMYLAELIAKSEILKFPKSAHNYEDLVQEAYIGLLQAIRAFSLEKSRKKKASFKTFATYRIRGAVYDAIRRNDTISRQWRKFERLAKEYTERIESTEKRTPDEEELADYLKIPISKYQEMIKLTQMQLLPSEDLTYIEDSSNEYDLIDNKVLVEEMLGFLSQREKMIIIRIYFYEESLTEIGKDVKISQSRVTQIKHRAEHKLNAIFSPGKANG